MSWLVQQTENLTKRNKQPVNSQEMIFYGLFTDKQAQQYDKINRENELWQNIGDVKNGIYESDDNLLEQIKEQEYEDDRTDDDWSGQKSYMNMKFLEDHQNIVESSVNSYLNELNKYNRLKKVRIQNLLEQEI